MPAVVRIKRRIDEEPLSAFILNSKKRRRLEAAADGSGDGSIEGAAGAAALVTAEGVADDKDEISTILKFAGTIQEQDDSATTQLARLTKEAAKELVLQKSMRPPSNHTERARQEMRQALHENRFRVVNCMRTTLADNDGDDDDVSAAAKEVTIVDIEKQETCKSSSSNDNGNAIETCSNVVVAGTSAAAGTYDQNGVQHQQQQAQLLQHATQQPTDSDTGYVYDLYLPENDLQAENVDMMDDNYLSIRPYDDLIFEDNYNNEEDEDVESTDSNDENYFANDYPDEEDDNEDGQEYYMDSYDHDQMNALEYGLGRMRVDNSDGYIHTFDPEDSSPTESDASSSDVYYYEDEDKPYGAHHTDDDSKEDDDDVDYYDAGGNSDESTDD